MLAIESLSVRAGAAPLLTDISLRVAPGEMLVLAGASGSGKSTVALSILGLLPPGLSAAGGILLAGQNILAMPPRALPALRGRAAGLAFQDAAAALDPTARVGAQVAEAFRCHHNPSRAAARAEAARLLAAMHLPPSAARAYPHQLSGGQRQRALLAAALSGRPALLIADEITANLDTETAAAIMAELDALRAAGLGVLFITHDLSLARAHATHVQVLDGGRTMESAPAPAFFAGATSAAGRALLEASAIPRPSLPPPGPIVLRAENIALAYPGQPRPVFENLSFALRRGACLGIEGPSGAGKTSLARAVLGMLPVRGRLTLDGKPVRDRAVRGRIQPVFQDPAQSLDPRMTVAEILGEPARIARVRRAPAALLASVGLPDDYLARRPAALSGGQAQRVALARALAAEPAVLVLDEPTSSLDAVTESAILELLASVLASGVAMLLISHSARVLRALSSEIVVLKPR